MSSKKKSKEKGVSVSLMNWACGRGLVTGTSRSTARGLRQISDQKLAIYHNDSTDEDYVVIKKKTKKCDSKTEKGEEEKKDGEQGKDGKKVKKACKTCGCAKEKDGDKVKKDDVDKSMKNDGNKEKKDEKDEKEAEVTWSAWNTGNTWGDTDAKEAGGEDKGWKTEEKTSEEAPGEKSDDKKDTEEKSGDKKAGGNQGWTDDQLATLKRLKESNTSWKDIATELKTSQADCKVKWKEIQSSGHKNDDTGRSSKQKDGNKAKDVRFADKDNVWAAGGDKSDTWGEGKDKTESVAQASPWGEPGDTAKETEPASGSTFNDQPADSGQDFSILFQSEPAKPNSPKQKNDNSIGWSKKGNGKNKNNGGNQNKSQNTPENTPFDGGSFNAEAFNQNNDANKGRSWNTPSSYDNAPPIQFTPPVFQMPSNLASTAAPAPPGLKHLRPDNIWSRSDCEVLEMLMKQYREHKWLHMQAGFFNWTGRMVSDEILMMKFQADGWFD